MAKTARSEVVAVRFTPRERETIEALAERMGGVSLSDCIRSATKMYAKLRLDARYVKKYWEPWFLELVQSGQIAEMDLTPTESQTPKRRG
jgi:hypothetical protein